MFVKEKCQAIFGLKLIEIGTYFLNNIQNITIKLHFYNIGVYYVNDL